MNRVGLVLVACLALGACGEETYPWFIIEDNVPGDHAAIEAEHLEAFDWYAARRGLDRDDFADRLTIYVKAEPWPIGEVDGKPMQAAGTYTHSSSLLKVAILDGVDNNAFFHELLHREAALDWGLYQEIEEGKESWAHHTFKFLFLAEEIRRAWLLEGRNDD